MTGGSFSSDVGETSYLGSGADRGVHTEMDPVFWTGV